MFSLPDAGPRATSHWASKFSPKGLLVRSEKKLSFTPSCLLTKKSCLGMFDAQTPYNLFSPHISAAFLPQGFFFLKAPSTATFGGKSSGEAAAAKEAGSWRKPWMISQQLPSGKLT